MEGGVWIRDLLEQQHWLVEDEGIERIRGRGGGRRLSDVSSEMPRLECILGDSKTRSVRYHQHAKTPSPFLRAIALGRLRWAGIWVNLGGKGLLESEHNSRVILRWCNEVEVVLEREN